jgi:hypothetical protein
MALGAEEGTVSAFVDFEHLMFITMYEQDVAQRNTISKVIGLGLIYRQED